MNRHSILLFSLVSVAAAVSWWLSYITAPDRAVSRGAEEFPDSYAEDLTVIAYNQQGEPRYKLISPMMRHYEQSDTTKLDQPLLWQYNSDKPPWEVQGKQAILYGKKDSLFMSGEVQIDREGTRTISSYHLTTRNLTLKTTNGYAETKEAIHLTGNDYKIEAVGMQGWLQDPVRIKLLNNARGRYEIR